MSKVPPSVLYLTRYDRLGASSRYRFFQFFPALEASGVRCTAAPLFDAAYLQRRYQRGGGGIGDLARAVLRRLGALLTARSYDLVVIEYELMPYLPALLERCLVLLGVRYLVEYDDAIFHRYDRSPHPLVRTLLSGKIASVMRHSCLTIAGNDYLADYARRAGAPRVETVPTVLDLGRYPAPPAADNPCFTIGWIGSPSTSQYLLEVAEPLAAVCAGGRGRLVLIGADPVDLPGVPVLRVPWSEATEVAQICSFDVGIMPLPETPWAQGKCGFKLIQYMACGLPVVASPVGVNSRIVEQGSNGFLAQGTGQWIAALSALRDDRALRVRMGKTGRGKVEKQYSTEVVAPELVRIIKDLTGARR